MRQMVPRLKYTKNGDYIFKVSWHMKANSNAISLLFHKGYRFKYWRLSDIFIIEVFLHKFVLNMYL